MAVGYAICRRCGHRLVITGGSPKIMSTIGAQKGGPEHAEQRAGGMPIKVHHRRPGAQANRRNCVCVASWDIESLNRVVPGLEVLPAKQSDVNLRLKVRLLQAEAAETQLNGCVTVEFELIAPRRPPESPSPSLLGCITGSREQEIPHHVLRRVPPQDRLDREH